MRRILRYFRTRRFDLDLAAEVQAHLDEKTDQLIAAGQQPEAARSHAIRMFGNRTQLLETCRERWVFRWLDEMARDVRYAVRLLRKSSAFTGVAVLSLALGIGANTIIFSAVDNVLLHSLPYPRADRLFAVWSRQASHGAETMHVSAADFYDWRRESRAFQSLATYASWPMNLTNIDEPRRLETQLVSASLFSTLGVQAQIGRTFAPDEDREGGAFVVVISHHLWRALGESPHMIGRQLTINGSPATVIGVMPAGFAFPARETDAWVPLSMSAKDRANREGRWLTVIGRLAPEVTRQDAATEMDIISGQLAAAYPATNTGWRVSLVPLQEEVVGSTRPVLLTLQACGLLLLLIACANLANLLLAKGAARSREIGMRAALGAGRSRILRQLIIESVVLAAVGGGLGLALAIQGTALARTLGDGLIPRANEIRLSAPVVLFALAAAVLTALICGLAPALQGSRVDLRTHIGSRSRGTQRNLQRQYGMLIAIEIGLASVLLVGAGLLGRSLVQLLRTAPGLRTDHVLTMRLTLPRSKYPTNVAQTEFFQQIVEHVRNLPGITAAAEISDTPLDGNNPTFEFVVEGMSQGPSDTSLRAGLRLISTGYLRAAGIPLLGGRDFTVDDRPASRLVAIINETMARRYWRGADPVGQVVRLKEDQRRIAVVGVVADIKHMGLKVEEGLVVYVPYAQKTQEWLAWTTLLVRTAGEPMESAAAVRNAIRDLDKTQPIAGVGTLEDLLSHSTAVPRFATLVFGVVSGFALLIAVVGVYGLLAYTIAQWLPEIGIRLTLGASQTQVSWLLQRQTMMRVLVGVAFGLFVAWWLARGLESLLFVVHPHDPVTFAGVAAVLLLASMTAVLVPARRALRVDVTTTLRAE